MNIVNKHMIILNLNEFIINIFYQRCFQISLFIVIVTSPNADH